ncbi:Glycosyl transferase family 2 [Rhodococcus triatomae]|uniref:Glycosyl transferase family 2 n=1 Tax=Rhodococcus triatomae TaxID=300028 RepID=A0A1G7ZM36_9NOCA|nr:Glycosyl transferase family 2 [Rhodococcus triatomae]
MVVPVYRCLPYVTGTLQSVLDQTRPVDEIVLVDDRGGDRSMPVARAFLDERGAAYRVVTHDRNRGPGPARNSGLAAATGDLLWFLDADDVADPRFVERLAGAVVGSGADFAVCRTRRVDEHGVVLGVDEPPYPAEELTGREFARLLLRGRAKAYPCTKLFRRSVLGDRPWDEHRKYEDIAATFRLAMGAGRVALVDEPLYRYLHRSGSITTTLSEGTFDLFGVGDDVRSTVLEDGFGSDWAADLLGFEYREVLTSIAHVAMRASHVAAERPALYRDAVRRVRARIRLRDLPRLARTGHPREAVFGAFMTVSPAAYSTVLRYR